LLYTHSIETAHRSERAAMGFTVIVFLASIAFEVVSRSLHRKISYDIFGVSEAERPMLSLQPRGWVRESPTIKYASFSRYLYWCSGLVVAGCLLGASLPELLVGQNWSAMSIKITKALLAAFLLFKESKLLEMRTIPGSLEAESRGMTDTKWNGRVLQCNFAMLPFTIWFTLEFLSYDPCSMLENMRWDLERVHAEKRPAVMNICDAIALILLWSIFLCRMSIHYVQGWLHRVRYIWIIRKVDEPWNCPVQLNVLDAIFGFIHPSVLMDSFLLDHRLSRRMTDRCFRDFAVAKEVPFVNIPDVMYQAKEVLLHPKVDMIDYHTQLMVYLVKMVVEGGRAEPILPSLIKPPFRKLGAMRMWESPIAGIKFALSDEHYSVEKEGEVGLAVEATDFTKSSEIGLAAHTMLPGPWATSPRP
jgi:hypothetical protein